MGQRTNAYILTFVLFLAFAWNATARNAIGFSEAPEMSSGFCTGKTIASALDCAKKKCIKNGGDASACMEVTACYPANWSIDVVLLGKAGNSWHEIFCGFDSKETALQAAKSVCNMKRRTDLAECEIAKIYNEDGKEFDAPKP